MEMAFISVWRQNLILQVDGFYMQFILFHSSAVWIRQQFSRVMWVNRIERVMQDKDRKFKFIYNLEYLEVVYENDLSSDGQD